MRPLQTIDPTLRRNTAYNGGLCAHAAPKSGFEMCSAPSSFFPSTFGASGKTRLESSMKKCKPHFIYEVRRNLTSRRFAAKVYIGLFELLQMLHTYVNLHSVAQGTGVSSITRKQNEDSGGSAKLFMARTLQATKHAESSNASQKKELKQRQAYFACWSSLGTFWTSTTVIALVNSSRVLHLYFVFLGSVEVQQAAHVRKKLVACDFLALCRNGRMLVWVQNSSMLKRSR